LFELAKGFLPPGFRGALIRQVEFEDVKVRDMVTRAHNLADWVITYDKVASATLLQRYEAQIISDMTVPGAEGRVIISSGKVDARLKRNIQDELQRACALSTESREKGADEVIRDVPDFRAEGPIGGPPCQLRS
jgi:DNA segregation ATPase FtsK/SpoIIIE, S-DNA-T family